MSGGVTICVATDRIGDPVTRTVSGVTVPEVLECARTRGFQPDVDDDSTVYIHVGDGLPGDRREAILAELVKACLSS